MLSVFDHLKAAEKVREERAKKEAEYWRKYWKMKHDDIAKRYPPNWAIEPTREPSKTN